MELVERKVEVRWLWSHFLVSQRRICELLNVAESSQRYVSRKNDEVLRTKLVEAAREKPRWGYRRLQFVLKEKGMEVNHKKVYRVYREAGLMIRRRRRKRLLRVGFVRPAVTGANQEWALDFVHDAAESGRKFRVLSVIDVYTRECLALEVETSFASPRVTRELEKIVAERGVLERELVRKFVRGTDKDRGVEGGIQRRTAAQQLGISGATRVRAASCDAPVAYGSLRAATRRTG